LCIAENLPALDHAAQLANIAGPAVAQQKFLCLRANAQRWLTLNTVQAQKMFDQEFDIFYSLAHGRQVDGNDLEAI
jgi:hypothetical protein